MCVAESTRVCGCPQLALSVPLLPMVPLSGPLRNDVDHEEAELLFEEYEDQNDAWLPSSLGEEEDKTRAPPHPHPPGLGAMSVHS